MFKKIYVCVFIILSISSCEKEWKNIYDDNFDPLASAPSVLTIKKIGNTSIELNWNDNSHNNEGFKIDRKIDTSSWITYATLNNSTRFVDSNLAVTGTYYYRVYAFSGSNYSSFCEAFFIFKLTPTVTTFAVKNITANSIYCGGNVISSGASAVTAKGVCWDTSANPTTDNNKTMDGEGNGSFTSFIHSLSESTTYYVRAYATSDLGTEYGASINFSTISSLDNLNVETISVSDVSHNTANCGGNVSGLGGSAVMAKGVCWSTSQFPKITDFFTMDGDGSGSFSSSLTELEPNTTYYVRAYATANGGTKYGNTVSFNTLALSLGQNYSGGVIAYILKSGDPGYDSATQHGIIAATSDQSSGIQWDNGNHIATGVSNSDIGYGNSNTNSIVNLQGPGQYAARLCYDLVENGYSDWYLPSQHELYYVYGMRTSIGGFMEVDYWSSSESSISNAKTVDFKWSYMQALSKDASLPVRCVRSF